MSPGTVLLGALLVGIGGGAGSALRWWLRDLGMREAARRYRNGDVRVKPWLTFFVNVLASFLLGLIVARLGSSAAGVAERLHHVAGAEQPRPPGKTREGGCRTTTQCGRAPRRT